MHHDEPSVTVTVTSGRVQAAATQSFRGPGSAARAQYARPRDRGRRSVAGTVIRVVPVTAVVTEPRSQSLILDGEGNRLALSVLSEPPTDY
jgi:hypothetical protein